MSKRNYWWLFLLPCLPILAAWDRFIIPAGTNTSDILISHYPNLLFIQKSLASGQGIPLWSPLILSGYPFSANPLSSLAYPPAWISLLFPLPLGINLVMAAHVFLGCLGFYQLLCQLNLSKGIAILGGVVFGFLPAGYSHIIAGHFTWVCASAWLPWLLISGLNYWKPGWKTTIYAGACLGMMLLADMRFAAYGGIFWLAVLVFNYVSKSMQGTLRNLLESLGKVLVSLVLAAGISAAVWLPLLEYAALSTRSLMTIRDAFYLSLPPVQLTGLFVPGHPSSMEWIIYPGAGCILLLLIAFSFFKIRKVLIFWLGLGLICLMWSLGDINPINRWLVSLPGFDLLRVPARGVYFLGIAILITAMLTLDHLIKNNPEKAVFLRLGTLFITIFVVMIQLFITAAKPEKNMFLIWHMAFWLILAGLILCFSYRKIASKYFLVLLGIFMIADLAFSDMNLFEWKTVSDALSEGRAEAQYLSETKSDFRVFSPSYSIPQQTAAFYGLELADGIDPMQLTSYSDYIHQAANLETNGYSVTLPPFRSGEPTSDNVGIKPDAKAFRLLNVQYLVSAFPITSDGWEMVKNTDMNYIYLNQQIRGWAWVESNSSTGSDDFLPVNEIDRGSNKIDIKANGPGKLVLSEVYYPGWQARVDGQPAVIQTAHDVLRSVELSEGLHQIEFQYVPCRLFAGVGISLFTIILGIFISRVKKAHA